MTRSWNAGILLLASSGALAAMVVGHVVLLDVGHERLPTDGWHRASGGNKTMVWTTVSAAGGDRLDIQVGGSYPDCLLGGQGYLQVPLRWVTANVTFRSHNASNPVSIRLTNTTGNGSIQPSVYLFGGCVSLGVIGGATARFLVVEDGEQYKLMRNETPDRVYLEREGSAGWSQTHHMRRPPPSPKAATEDLNGTAVPIGADRLAVVFLIEDIDRFQASLHRAGRFLAANSEHQASELLALGPLEGPADFDVHARSSWLAPVNVGLLVGEAVALAVMLAAARSYLAVRPSAASDNGSPLPDLLLLSQRVEQYLRTLRWYVRGLGMALALAGALAAVAALRWAGSQSEETGVDWLAWPVTLALLAAYSGVLVVWLRHYWIVSDEFKAWSAQRTSPPDLV